MARPNSLPWNISTFTGNEPVSRLGDNDNSVNNVINDSGAGWCNYAVDTGSANAYVLTLASAPAAYSSGMITFFKPANSNTGASAININSVGSVSILTPAGNALLGGEISINQVIGLIFDGTNFRIIPPCPAVATLIAITGNKTLECAGCTSVSVYISWNVATSTSIVLNHLGIGVPVSVAFANASGSNNAFLINATDPGGTNYNQIGTTFASALTGGVFISLVTGGTLNSGNNIMFCGVTSGIPGAARLYMTTI